MGLYLPLQMPEHAWYSLYSAQVRHVQSSVSSFGILSRRKMWAYWSHSSEGPLKWFRDWGIWYLRRGWGRWDHHSFNMENRRLRGDLINVHKYPMGRSKENQVVQRVCGGSILGGTCTLTGKISEWPALAASLRRGCGWNDLQRFLPTSAIPWFLGGDLACWRFTTTEYGLGKEFLLIKLAVTLISSANLLKVFFTEIASV